MYENNIEKGDKVCLFFPNSIELVVSILAVLKLGACYIPIDVSYPIERVKYIAQNSSCKKILTNTKLEDLDNLCLGISLPNATTIYENKYKPDLQDLAYIILLVLLETLKE